MTEVAHTRGGTDFTCLRSACQQMAFGMDTTGRSPGLRAD